MINIGVTGSGDLLVGRVITLRAGLICIPTDSGTGCSLSGVINIGVTGSGDSEGLTVKLYLTNGTVNYIIVRSVVYTIGVFVIFCDSFAFGVAESVNRLLSHENLVASRAVRSLGETGFGTGRSYSLIRHLVVTLSEDRLSLTVKL